MDETVYECIMAFLEPWAIQEALAVRYNSHVSNLRQTSSRMRKRKSGGRITLVLMQFCMSERTCKSLMLN